MLAVTAPPAPCHSWTASTEVALQYPGARRPLPGLNRRRQTECAAHQADAVTIQSRPPVFTALHSRYALAPGCDSLTVGMPPDAPRTAPVMPRAIPGPTGHRRRVLRARDERSWSVCRLRDMATLLRFSNLTVHNRIHTGETPQTPEDSRRPQLREVIRVRFASRSSAQRFRVTVWSHDILAGFLSNPAC